MTQTSALFSPRFEQGKHVVQEVQAMIEKKKITQRPGLASAGEGGQAMIRH